MRPYLRFLLVCVIILGASSGLPAQSPSEKDLQKRKVKYWKQELKVAKSNDHQRAARNNPNIGWLSGLWCKENDPKPYRHVEIKGAWNFRMATRGYLAASEKTVIKPESILYSEMEFLGKKVVGRSIQLF